MIGLIKQELIRISKDIDAGNSNISEEDAISVAKALKEYTRKDEPMSKYQAYTYLNMSRAKFDLLVLNGKLPEGKKMIGWKEKSWYKKDLDEYIRASKEKDKN